MWVFLRGLWKGILSNSWGTATKWSWWNRWKPHKKRSKELNKPKNRIRKSTRLCYEKLLKSTQKVRTFQNRMKFTCPTTWWLFTNMILSSHILFWRCAPIQFSWESSKVLRSSRLFFIKLGLQKLCTIQTICPKIGLTSWKKISKVWSFPNSSTNKTSGIILTPSIKSHKCKKRVSWRNPKFFPPSKISTPFPEISWFQLSQVSLNISIEFTNFSTSWQLLSSNSMRSKKLWLTWF